MSLVQRWIELCNRIRNFFEYDASFSKDSECKHRVLCVDDDRDFCRFIERTALSLRIKVDKVYSVKEAKAASEKFSGYRAYIIDGHLPDGSGLDLIAWMRETKGIDAPIGFLSRIYQDAGSFRRLKERYRVKYVLDKPMKKEAVCRFLSQLVDTEDLSENFPEAALNELKEQYDRTVFDKVDKLQKLILALQKDPCLENMRLLKEEVHKIGGSAGSYGYDAVSRLCKTTEQEISERMHIGGIDSAWLISLDRFFARVKLHFQIPEEF